MVTSPSPTPAEPAAPPAVLLKALQELRQLRAVQEQTIELMQRRVRALVLGQTQHQEMKSMHSRVLKLEQGRARPRRRAQRGQVRARQKRDGVRIKGGNEGYVNAVCLELHGEMMNAIPQVWPPTGKRREDVDTGNAHDALIHAARASPALSASSTAPTTATTDTGNAHGALIHAARASPALSVASTTHSNAHISAHSNAHSSATCNMHRITRSNAHSNATATRQRRASDAVAVRAGQTACATRRVERKPDLGRDIIAPLNN